MPGAIVMYTCMFVFRDLKVQSCDASFYLAVSRQRACAMLDD